MRRMFAVIVLSIFALAVSTSYAQAQDVPDFSRDGWRLVEEVGVDMQAVTADGSGMELIPTTAKYFVNDKTGFEASILMWQGNEVAMFFYTDKETAWLALRVNGSWHRASQSGWNLKVILVLDKDGVAEKVRLILDTVNGEKELVLDLR